MRLWVSDADRRPDPEPLPSDDRTAIIVGTALWVVALAVVLIVALSEQGMWLIVTCLIGVALGVVGLVYSKMRKR